MGVWRDGQVEIIPDAEGNRLWPSALAFTDRGRRFGTAAQPTPDSAGNPAGTVRGAKRFLGRHRNDPELQRDAGLLAVSVAASDGEEHAGLTGVMSGGVGRGGGGGALPGTASLHARAGFPAH
jgi:molecular chaperone DnaK (HSP70)